jgi:hypothetical protein
MISRATGLAAGQNEFYQSGGRRFAFHRILFLGEFGNRRETFMHWTALPITVLVRLHFIKASVFVNSSVHAASCHNVPTAKLKHATPVPRSNAG